MKTDAERLQGVEWAVISAVVALGALTAISVFVVGFDSLANSVREFDLTMLGISFVLMAWQLACRFLRWLLFARRLGLKVPVAEAVLYYAAGMSMALTPGRVGETLRLWFLEKRLAVPYRRIAGLYVADRAGDAIAYLILLAVGSVSYARGVPIAWGALLAIVAGTLILMKPGLLIALLTALYARLGRGRKLLLWVRRALRNTSTLFQPRVFVPGVAIGTLGWLAAPVLLAASLSQLGVDLDPLRAVFVYAAAALAGGSTMMPGGGGATETVLVVLLTASNVPLDAAVAAMIVSRLAFLFVPIALGMLVLPMAFKLARGPTLGQ